MQHEKYLKTFYNGLTAAAATTATTVELDENQSSSQDCKQMCLYTHTFLMLSSDHFIFSVPRLGKYLAVQVMNGK